MTTFKLKLHADISVCEAAVLPGQALRAGKKNPYVLGVIKAVFILNNGVCYLIVRPTSNWGLAVAGSGLPAVACVTQDRHVYIEFEPMTERGGDEQDYQPQ